MKRFFLLLTVFLLIAVCACAEGNLLLNADFTDGDGDWETSAWLTDDETVFTLSVKSYGAGQSVMIESLVPNDARFEQTIFVEPNAIYKVRAMVMAEGIALSGGGANLSIANTYSKSDYLYDTNGEWRELVVYGETGRDQEEMTLYARLGFYGQENTGKVWFDDLSIERVDRAPDGDAILSFATLPPAYEEEAIDEFPSVNEPLGDDAIAALIVLFALLSSALIAALIYLFATGILKLPKGDGAALPLLIAGLIAAFAVRIAFAASMYGYEVDMNCFFGWGYSMLENGPSRFYSNVSFCDYPPGYMYVLWLLAGIKQLFQIEGGASWALFKLPQILADIAAALIIFRASKKTLGAKVGALLALLYAFFPLVILNSAAWGQIDSILALLLVLTLYCAIEDKWHFALPAFALSVLVKPQALMLAPLGLVLMIMEVYKRREKKGFGLYLSLCALGSIIGMVIVAWPFVRMMRPVSGMDFGMFNPVAFLVELYGKTLSQYPHITINALNLYALIQKNWVDLVDVPGLAAFAWAMFAVSFAYTIFLYIKSGDKRRMFLCGATLLTLVFTFGAKMHERYAFPALLMLIFAYLYDRDIRILAAAVALSLAQFINTGLVLAFEHIQGSMWFINGFACLVNIGAALFLAYTAWDVILRGRVVGITKVYQPRVKPVLNERAEAQRLFRPQSARMNLTLRDYAIMAAISAAYAVFTFVNLGSTLAPQTMWTSTAAGEQVTFDLGEVKTYHLAYYGYADTTFTVELSDDGVNFTSPERAQFGIGEVFRWMWYTPSFKNDNDDWDSIQPSTVPHTSRYARLTAEASGLRLFEVAFLNEDRKVLAVASIRGDSGAGDPVALIDEQNTVPEYPSYYNGTYFDEIYHARTAYEHLHGLHTFEWTHPPLGKLLIMLGIKMFGMTPFGWRFMGALFGVFMLPLIYLLAKQLIKRRSIATLAMALFALDSMHFTQTRIATIDTYGVFFIMLMYFFMLRYSQMNFNIAKLPKTLVPLSLCGLSMGLAIASKWIGLYGASGLAVMLLISLIMRFNEYRFARRNLRDFEPEHYPVAKRTIESFWLNVLITLGVCLIVFIAVPALIYYFSYYLQLAPDGNFSIQGVVDVQKSMFGYHAGLGDDPHFFRSPYYEWPLIVKPMWYYEGNQYLAPGMVSSISCMGNPAVWWVGLAALIWVIFVWCRGGFKDRRYMFVIIGFMAQYLPWVLVPRSTFIYHYFASVPFIILATALVFDFIRARDRLAYKVISSILVLAALVLLVMFYPLMSGTPVPNDYAMHLRWFDWYNFKPAALEVNACSQKSIASALVGLMASRSRSK